MTLIPELERALTRAIAPHSPRARRAWWRRVPLLASLATVLLGTAVALAATGVVGFGAPESAAGIARVRPSSPTSGFGTVRRGSAPAGTASRRPGRRTAVGHPRGHDDPRPWLRRGWAGARRGSRHARRRRRVRQRRTLSPVARRSHNRPRWVRAAGCSRRAVYRGQRKRRPEKRLSLPVAATHPASHSARTTANAARAGRAQPLLRAPRTPGHEHHLHTRRRDAHDQPTRAAGGLSDRRAARRRP